MKKSTGRQEAGPQRNRSGKRHHRVLVSRLLSVCVMLTVFAGALGSSAAIAGALSSDTKIDHNPKVKGQQDSKFEFKATGKYGVEAPDKAPSVNGLPVATGAPATKWPLSNNWYFQMCIKTGQVWPVGAANVSITLGGSHKVAPCKGNEIAPNGLKTIESDKQAVGQLGVNFFKQFSQAHPRIAKHTDVYSVKANLKHYVDQITKAATIGGSCAVSAKHQVPVPKAKKKATSTVGSSVKTGAAVGYNSRSRKIRISPKKIDVLDSVGGTSGSIVPKYQSDSLTGCSLQIDSVTVWPTPDSTGAFHTDSGTVVINDPSQHLKASFSFSELVIRNTLNQADSLGTYAVLSDVSIINGDTAISPASQFLNEFGDEHVVGAGNSTWRTSTLVLTFDTQIDFVHATLGFTRDLALPANVFMTGAIVPEDVDTCNPLIYGDINGDGLPFATADYVFVRRHVEYGLPLPCPIYEGDLDGNCRVDSADVDLMYRAAFEGYVFSEYPITTCNPACQPASCCTGTRGNVNMAGIVDLADLSSLVSYLTGGGFLLPCVDEANVNGVGIVDLADLSALVSYLTGGGYVLPACGAAAAPAAKPVDGASAELSAQFDGKTTTIFFDAPYPVRAVQVDLAGETAESPTNLLAGTMDEFHGRRENRTTVILIDTKGKAVIEGNRVALLLVPGKAEIVNASLADLSHSTVIPRFSNMSKLGTLPTGFNLDQNYPNPFNPTTQISFSLPTASAYTLTIYNVNGQKVTEFSGAKEAGSHSVTFDGKGIASGVYFYRLVAADFAATRKMLLLK